MSAAPRWLWGVAVLVVAATVGLAFRFVERVEDEFITPARGHARYDEFYALELLLTDLGIPARGVQGLPAPPPTDQVVLLLAPDRRDRALRVRRLVDWVERGGHLVVAPREPVEWSLDEDDGEDDEGEDALSADTAAREDTGGAGGVVVTELGVQVYGARSLHVGGVRFAHPATGEALEIAMDDGRRLWVEGVQQPGGHAGRWTVWSDASGGLVLASVPVGRGRVTAVADVDFLESEQLGERDHARVAWLLSTLHGTPAGAVVVYRDDAPSRLGWVWAHAWQLCASGAVALGVWLWGASRRLGPLLPEPQRVRRSLREHIEASGELLWRYRHDQALLQSARTGQLARLRSRFPETVGLDGAELVGALSDATGLEAEQVRLALFGGGVHDAGQFHRAIAALSRLGAKKRND